MTQTRAVASSTTHYAQPGTARTLPGTRSPDGCRTCPAARRTLISQLIEDGRDRTVGELLALLAGAEQAAT